MLLQTVYDHDKVRTPSGNERHLVANEVDNKQPVGETDDAEREHDLAPNNIVDKVVFGRRLRAQRVLQGYDRVGQLTHVLRSRYGIDVSDRTIYAIERGEQMPHLDFVLAAMDALEMNFVYLAPSVRHDVWAAIWKRRAEQSS